MIFDKTKTARHIRRTAFALTTPMVVLIGLAASILSAKADPCGMVPPIHIEGAVPLERMGLQKTFVFYKNGIETFVIRPGFRGRVEEFGMLIPFPSPPALRKVPDDTFAHIAAAIDPPEVVVDLTPPPPMMEMAVSDEVASESRLAVNQVNVLKQEAVGMYEVAVLEAGSAAALNQWMADHGYRYPEGMDAVCNDYIDEKWCFVAVKARVGRKSDVDPRPGMKQAASGLPPGSSFDGHVQGMGFRFRSDELVVPMRLSAFNGGDLHNVVYLLTEGPMKPKDMPAGHVVRQIDGRDLIRNLTQPLPLRIIGGKYEDIPMNRQLSLSSERDPAPHNGIAKDLFATDLVAARTGNLSHEHEELEKELLEIGERLGLRGKEIDQLHEDAIRESRDQVTKEALSDLESMTMTVIDAGFEREVVAKQNIYFASFEMNPSRNTSRRYNARMFGPSEKGFTTADNSTVPPAVVVDDPNHGRLILQSAPSRLTPLTLLVAIGLLVTIGFVVMAIIKRAGGKTAGFILLAGLSSPAIAQESSLGNPQEALKKVSEVIDEIQSSSDRSAAISRIHAYGDDAVTPLLDLIRIDERIARRGWAVVCLKEINSGKSANALDGLVTEQSMPRLIQTWAASARIDDVTHLEDLQRFSDLCPQIPALRRPLRLRIVSMTAEQKDDSGLESLLKFCLADYQLQQALSPVLVRTSPASLSKVLLTSPDTDIRRQAAAWLATQKQQRVKGVNRELTAALRFDAKAEAPPWGNGPLFIPGVNWNRKEAVALVSELTAWLVWCSANEQNEDTSKIINGLNSFQLMNAAGYRRVSGDVSDWLSVWESVIGKDDMQALMQRTGFRFSPARLERATEDN